MRFTRLKVSICFTAVCLTVVIYLMISNYLDYDNEVRRLRNVPHGEHPRAPSRLAAAVHVCMTSDENTIIGAVATINSVRRNTRHPVRFHLVTSPASEAHLRSWIEGSTLRDIDFDIKVFDETKLKDKIRVRGGRAELAKPMNYARFYYGELFPEVRGIMIHLDDDIIVQGDIFELAHAKIEDGAVLVVSDECGSPSKRFNPVQPLYSSFVNFVHPRIQKLGMKPNRCSFNTGLYVADLDKWRENNITEQLEYWMELNTRENVYGNERGGGGSQPPMMIVLHEKYSLLKDPMWHIRNLGLTPASRFSKHFVEHAKLLHWNGRFKPWGGVAQFSHVWDRYAVPDPRGEYRPVRKSRSRGGGAAPGEKGSRFR